MVADPKRGPLTAFDWAVLGHEYDPEAPTLPGLRLHVPMPPTADGLHNLAHKLAGLSEALHSYARMSHTDRSAIHDAMGHIRLLDQELKRLRAAWVAELEQMPAKPGENVEQLRIR